MVRSGLSKLFLLLENNESCYVHKRPSIFPVDSFCDLVQYEQPDIDFVLDYFSNNSASALNEAGRNLCQLCYFAFDSFIHAWISELSIEQEILFYGRKVLKAALEFDCPKKKRFAAQKAAEDRTDTGTLIVLNTAQKVRHEINRMYGFLRFSPAASASGEFAAKFAPDHFILPALGAYFTARFGETAWSIIDEKRSLCLHRRPAEKPKITAYNEETGKDSSADHWECLWKHYHKTINNEDRNNPNLQRQFMPKKYWKYVSEMS